MDKFFSVDSQQAHSSEIFDSLLESNPIPSFETLDKAFGTLVQGLSSIPSGELGEDGEELMRYESETDGIEGLGFFHYLENEWCEGDGGLTQKFYEEYTATRQLDEVSI